MGIVTYLLIHLLTFVFQGIAERSSAIQKQMHDPEFELSFQSTVELLCNLKYLQCKIIALVLCFLEIIDILRYRLFMVGLTNGLI